MGVINLGTLVETIRKKLSGSFIKATDYATTSKAGIVKIGSGVNVTSDGTISVSTQAPLKIIDVNDISYSQNEYQEIQFTPPADISKYHFAVISGRLWADECDFGIVLPIETFLGNKRTGVSEVVSTVGGVKTIIMNVHSEDGNYYFRVTTAAAVSAGRVTVHLI